MIISRTPFRISFFGGGTDYPTWLENHPGASLVTTIDKYCYISCRYLPPFFDHKSRIVYSKIEAVKTVEQIQHPAVRMALSSLGIKEGLEIHHDADLPARTGIGSSSSFAVGLLNALRELKGISRSKYQLAEEAIYLEQTLCNENVGCQDQISTTFGGLNHLRFNKEGFTVEKVKISQERIKELESHLMLFFTGFSRIASKVAKHQIKNIPNKEAELMAIYNMVIKAVDILHTGDILDFGRLLHDSWLLKRSLSDKVSTYIIDEYYKTAILAGALGGKLLGAGGGGFLLLFVEPDKQERVRKHLSHLLEVPFKFENMGTQIIGNHNV